MNKKPKNDQGNFLVAILRKKSDFAILQEHGWYRIPVEHTPRRWPPMWLGFYQPQVFGKDAYRVRYFGKVVKIEIVTRRDLFPNEFENELSKKQYYKVHIPELLERDPPIISTRPRRLVFIPTTWAKFVLAEQINDIFDDSPLEDQLWSRLKKLEMQAERQWYVEGSMKNYQLDFALFCNEGSIDVETDGDSWHSEIDQIADDNARDNDIQTVGWRVLRFNSRQINEELEGYCLPTIGNLINRLGGLDEQRLIPRIFFSKDGEISRQMTLFESPDEYQVEESLDSLLD